MSNQAKNFTKTQDNFCDLPRVPLSLPSGYKNGKQHYLERGQKMTLADALGFFSVNLELNASIPFIYESVRTNAQTPQELSQALEALIEMHKAFARFINEDYDAFTDDFSAVIHGGKNDHSNL